MFIGVDHVLIAVEDMDQAMETYRRLGFQVSRGGEHTRMGTFNALVPLADGSYLELVGVKDFTLARQFPNTRLVAEALNRANRMAAFALGTNDLPGDVMGVRARGLNISDPLEGERLRPDGQQVAWRTAHFQDPDLPFLIADITPRQLRVPLPTEGLGRHAYLARLDVLSPSVPDSSRVWKNLLGFIPDQDDEFKLERCSIRLKPNDGQPTGLGALSIAVENWDEALLLIERGGVKHSERAGELELDRVALAGAQINLLRSA